MPRMLTVAALLLAPFVGASTLSPYRSRWRSHLLSPRGSASAFFVLPRRALVTPIPDLPPSRIRSFVLRSRRIGGVPALHVRAGEQGDRSFDDKATVGAVAGRSPHRSRRRRRWVDAAEAANVASANGIALRRLEDTLVDVAAYPSSAGGDDDFGSANEGAMRPSHYRIRRGAEACFDPAEAFVNVDRSRDKLDDDNDDISLAQDAAETTLRWCDDFVSHLNLCPWAKLSLTAPNAIRIHVVPQTLGIVEFESAVREAAAQLLRVTGMSECGEDADGRVDGGEDASRSERFDAAVDPNVAITFVVAPPPSLLADDGTPIDDALGQGCTDGFDFEPFHEFAIDLEERLFDEADEERGHTNEVGEEQCPHIGDAVTLAPFHPLWRFASASDADAHDDGIDWEKRTPYPTVSIVRTSAILAAGVEATERIGKHNADVLTAMGPHVLGDLFRHRVLLRGEDRVEKEEALSSDVLEGFA